MKKIICLILIAIICILSACGNNQNSTKATPDEKDKDSDVTEITDNKRKDIKSIIFNFSERSEGNTCFVNGSVVVGNDTGLYITDNNGELKRISENPIFRLCSVSNNIYYTVYKVTENEEYHELHQIKPDGSDDKVLCKVEDESLVDFIMQTGDIIYLMSSIDTISMYNMKDNSLTTAFSDDIGNIYALGNKMYYTSSDLVSSPISLYCYDTIENKATKITNKEYDNCKLFLNGENLYAIFDFDDYDNSGKCDIYKINTQTDSLEKVCTVSAENSLSLTGIINNTVFYQTYSENEGRFKTFTMKMNNSEVKTYEGVNYLLSSMYNIGKNACCFNTNSRKYRLVYDFDKEVFKSINTDDPGNETLYYDASLTTLFFDENQNNYFIANLDENKTPSIGSITLEDSLPRVEDMYIGSESSPDNEYLKLKKIFISRSGSCYWIPELTLNSDDAVRVNNELNSSEFYGFGQYYKSELHDGYLTFYTLIMGDSSSRGYKLYTFDVTTGRQLNNDEIIALVTNNKDDFYDALKNKLYEIQDDLFKGRGTDIENRNENKEPTDSTYENDSITNEMYEYVLSDDNLNSLQFGYAGSGKLLCVSGFRNIAGGYATEHLFEYEYGV